MSAINAAQGDNWGGIAELYYCKQSAADLLLDFEFERDNLSISQANIDANFFRLRFQTRSCNHDEVEKESPHNSYIDHIIEATFPKDRDDVTDQIEYVRGTFVCMIFKTINDDWRVLPYMRQLYDHRTGKEPKDTNGTTIKWGGLLAYKAPKITIT